jgi:folate-binding protein YgfZ
MIYLPDRAVIRLSGEDARSWLANLVTCDIAGLKPGEGRWGALLTPQGKILFDFLATADDECLYLDTDRSKAADFAKRLTFYKLRAKVAVENLSEGWTVHAALPSENLEPLDAISYTDPRQPSLGKRALAPVEGIADEAGISAYHAHRIGLGIPEGGKDFSFGEAFPHEVLMDMLGGVDFRKGCYVGQEVVSRMQHRGTARTRIVPVTGRLALPAAGAEVRIGDKLAGTLGSSEGSLGLAMLRLDRVEDGVEKGEALTAGEVALTVVKPAWWSAPVAGQKAAV